MKDYPNILLIAGTGRNVGKTLLACEIIEHISSTTKVVGVKISSHLHEVEHGQKVIISNDSYTIIEECLINNKDSSRMKQAGASVVFYIQSQKPFVWEAFLQLPIPIDCGAIVCESGGLHQYIKPGVFVMVEGGVGANKKSSFPEWHPVIARYDNGLLSISVDDLCFENNTFTYRTKSHASLL